MRMQWTKASRSRLHCILLSRAGVSLLAQLNVVDIRRAGSNLRAILSNLDLFDRATIAFAACFLQRPMPDDRDTRNFPKGSCWFLKLPDTQDRYYPHGQTSAPRMGCQLDRLLLQGIPFRPLSGMRE